METDFTKLNPLLSHSELGHSLAFKCPHCGCPVSIKVNLMGADQPPSTWGLFVVSGEGWESATITPSINDHPIGRERSGCHFSIIKGKVYP
jgi:hypothetical protein